MGVSRTNSATSPTLNRRDGRATPASATGTGDHWLDALAASRPWAGPSSAALTVQTSGFRPAAAPSAAPSLSLAAGCRLGPYRLVNRVGRGRQAEVWRAVRVDGAPGEVALKVLPASAASRDPRKLAQLRREADRGRRMANPSLISIHDYGEVGGLAYLAMPLIEGCPLGAVIDQRRSIAEGGVPKDEAHPLAVAVAADYIATVVGLMARVSRAVASAHQARVVHRDIKPMNILIGKLDGAAPGAGPGVYLCDFGLGRDLDVATPTQLRDGAGSPMYMAPERLLRREADEVRCDVYALGVTLYEALALVPPFEVPPEMPQPLWARHLASARAPSLQTLAPGVPVQVRRVVHRAMERAPERRHPTALRLAYDLERALADL